MSNLEIGLPDGAEDEFQPGGVDIDVTASMGWYRRSRDGLDLGQHALKMGTASAVYFCGRNTFRNQLSTHLVVSARPDAGANHGLDYRFRNSFLQLFHHLGDAFPEPAHGNDAGL